MPDIVGSSEVSLRREAKFGWCRSWKRSNEVRPFEIRTYIVPGSRTHTFALPLDRSSSLLTPMPNIINITPLTHSLTSCLRHAHVVSRHMSPSFANLSPFTKTSHNALNPHHVSVIDAPIMNPMPHASLLLFMLPYSPSSIFGTYKARRSGPAKTEVCV